MEFTYDEYQKMLEYIRVNNYTICDYTDYTNYTNPCILRHDVDNCLNKANDLAILENNVGVKSTYFIMLSSDFYNISSIRSLKIINNILDLGHDIGLHFDEVKYNDSFNIVEDILKEVEIMSDIIGYRVKTVSMHRPSKKTLESNYSIKDVVNSYSDEFFRNFKYISDSRRNWRGNPYDIIGKYDKLHILTHPFWYNNEDVTINKNIKKFINSACKDRYEYMKENITNIDEIISFEEVL